MLEKVDSGGGGESKLSSNSSYTINFWIVLLLQFLFMQVLFSKKNKAHNVSL